MDRRYKKDKQMFSLRKDQHTQIVMQDLDRRRSQVLFPPILEQGDREVGPGGHTENRRHLGYPSWNEAVVVVYLLIGLLDAREAGLVVDQPRFGMDPSLVAAEGHGLVVVDVNDFAEDGRESVRLTPLDRCHVRLGRSKKYLRPPLPRLRSRRRQSPLHQSVARLLPRLQLLRLRRRRRRRDQDGLRIRYSYSG